MSDIKNGYDKRSKAIDAPWWAEQMRKGESFRKKYSGETNWDTWRRYYRGQWPGGILPVNLYFKMIRTIVPRIYYRNPSISITASKPGMENILFAKILQRIDNKLIDTMGIKQTMKRMVQNAVMFGTDFGKLGYGTEYVPAHDMLDDDTEAPGEKHTRKRDNYLEYNSLVQPHMPWFLSCHPGNIILPEGTADYNAARWIAHHTTMPLADLQADKRFKNTADLKTSKSSFLGKKMRKDVPDDMIDLYEVHDKKTREVFVYAPFGDEKKIVFEGDDDMQVNGRLPFYRLVFNEDDESAWGVPDSQIIAPQQRELNETRTLIMKHRRISIVKLLVQQGALTADEESKLIDENVQAVIKIAGDPSTGIKELSPGNIPAGLIESMELTEREVQEILGLGTNQFGEYAPGSADRSATEANIVNQATQIRIDERRDMVADMLTDMVTDMHHILFERWDEEMVVDLAGPGGEPLWIKFKPEILKDARYSIKVDPDTSLPETKQLREQRAIQSYQLLKTNPMINPIALTQMLLNELQGVAYDNLMMMPQMPGTSEQNPMDIGQALNTIIQSPPQLQAIMKQWLEIQTQAPNPPPGAQIGQT